MPPKHRGGSIRQIFQKKPPPAKTPAVSFSELFSLFNPPNPSNEGATSLREHAANGNVYRAPTTKIPFTTRPAQTSTDSKGEMRPPPYYLEDLKAVEFSALIQALQIRLIQSGGQHTQHYLNIVAALESKYKELKDEEDPTAPGPGQLDGFILPLGHGRL